MTLKTTNFKKFAIQDVSKKKYSETFGPNVWERQYLSSNIQIFFGKPNASTWKKLQLKNNCPFDNYKITYKYLKVQFLKT